MKGLKIYLNHFPFLFYSGDNHGTSELFRHVHSNLHNFNIIDEHRLTMLQPDNMMWVWAATSLLCHMVS